LGLALVTGGLIAAFQWLPRYSPAGPFGIARPSLALSPLLWAAAGVACWRARAVNPVIKALAVMSVIMVIAFSAMLYSTAPDDAMAMIAHVGKLIGRVFLLLSLVQMGAIESVLRTRAERELRAL